MASKGRNYPSVRRTEDTEGYKNRKEGRVYSHERSRCKGPEAGQAQTRRQENRLGMGLKEMRLQGHRAQSFS